MRISIERCEAGLRMRYSASSSGISPPRCGRARRRNSSSSSGRPRLNGSITSTPSSIGRRTRKWPGKRHAVQRHAEAARDFHLHHRQRNRIAEPAVEHFVEIAVARVVVLVVVAAVAELPRTGAG